MTDLFTSFLIATATTAAANQLSHKPTVARGSQPPPLRDACARKCLLDWRRWRIWIREKKPPCWAARKTVLRDELLHFKAMTNRKRWTKATKKQNILCCHWILDRRKSVWITYLWHKNFAPVNPNMPHLHRFSVASSLLFSPCTSKSPQPTHSCHAATDLCICERYSVNPCWLKDSFVQC